MKSSALIAPSGCSSRQAHAVVLQLPPATCAERAAARVGHEGGVEGASAKRVAYGMAAQIHNAGLPSAAAEGIASVMVRARPTLPGWHTTGAKMPVLSCVLLASHHCDTVTGRARCWEDNGKSTHEQCLSITTVKDNSIRCCRRCALWTRTSGGR